MTDTYSRIASDTPRQIFTLRSENRLQAALRLFSLIIGKNAFAPSATLGERQRARRARSYDASMLAISLYIYGGDDMAFNIRNPTEVVLLHLLAKSEGRLQRSDFPTKQLLYKMLNENYVKKDSQGYKLTDKFKREYIERIDKSAKFGSTGSIIHEQGVVKALQMLPKEALSQVTNAAQLAAEHKDRVKTTEYRQAVQAIKNKLLEQRTQLQSQLQAAPSRLDSIKLKEGIREVDSYIHKLEDPHRGISPADLRVTLTRDQTIEVIDRMKEQYPEQAQQLQLVLESSQQQTITFLMEITTSHYEKDQIFSHSAYATIENLPIIYIGTS